MSKYIAAVVQAGSYPDEPLKSASKTADMIREAASRGARLAVFPEAFIGGFPKGASFGAPIGLRKPEGREAFRYICNDWAVIAILTLIAWGLIRIGVQRAWMSAYRGEADIAN